jgi:SAM-dependent methyltransferase
LHKILCQKCGLVREGCPFEAKELIEHYGHSYQLNTNESGEEHIFYTPSGPVPRSRLIHDWILEIKPDISGSVLEVGCGQGSVLEKLTASFPAAQCCGLDLNEHAVERARRKGLDVAVGGSAEIQGQYDLIVAFGVLEHVPSPTVFLKDLRAHLSKDGELIIGQPMQDVPSYDLFFIDHLHHFTTEHIRLFGEKAGLEEKAVLAGCGLVPNFSLHRFRKAATKKPNVHFRSPSSLQSVRDYLDAFARIDNLVSQTTRISVFGTGEVFALMYAYSKLASAEIVCGLDDNKDRRENHSWRFPVVRPEEAREFAVTDVLLSINPRYNEMVSKRLLALGLNPIPIL